MPGKATVITGMRRAGKTWFCYQDIQQKLAEGIDKNRLLYLNFEDKRLLPFTAMDWQWIPELFFNKTPGLRDQPCYWYLDEVQRLEGWELFVRRMLDTEQIHLCVTGSSSRLLSTEIATTLRDRSLTQEIFPYSFAEVLTRRHPEIRSPYRWGAGSRAAAQHTLEEYRRIGGFPEVQDTTPDLRRQVLRSYVDVVILRDVIERIGGSNVVALRALIRSLLSACATRFSVNRFYNALRSQGISCSKDDLYAYLRQLQDAYLIFLAPIYSRSEAVKRVNPGKVYVIDPGLIEALAPPITEDHGAALENMVYLRIRQAGLEPAYYVTEKGYEVDFIVIRDDHSRELVQVCWNMDEASTRERELRGLHAAMTELNLTTATIVTWMEERDTENGVRIVPAWKWLLE